MRRRWSPELEVCRWKQQCVEKSGTTSECDSLCSHLAECLEPVSDERMQRQEVGGSKFNAAAGAGESEQPPEATQHEKGTSLQNAGEEESARRPANTGHPVRPEGQQQ